MRVNNWAVGLFIAVGFGLLTALLFLIGDRQKAFNRHLDLRTEFSNLSGLANGAKVRVSGLDAGKLQKIEVPHTASAKFRLELQVEERVRGMIRKDSVVSIETDGVVGDKFILIKRGSDKAEEVQAGSMLPSKEPLELADLMDRGSTLLNDVHGSVGDIRGRVDGALDSLTRTVNHTDGLIVSVRPNLQKIAQDSGQITGNLNTLVADVNAGKGPVGMLLRDEGMKQQVQATLSNVKDTSQNLDQASVRANQVITDFQSRELIQKAQVSLENVQAVSQELNTTLKDALDEDNMGQNGAANLRETLSNLNRSTTNLSEDTEALKHNFFFRGFFKKRGFYNLDQITPNEYLEANASHKDAVTRKWIDASGFVVDGGDGKQQLSDGGRRQIDAEVAPLLDSLPKHVIVVEGYAANGSPDQQFINSRRRADLVRRYLEAHFHVRHSDVGIVPLKNTPPQNAGRDNWDGAAIALLDAQTKK